MSKRLFLLGWLIFPLLIIVISLNYIGHVIAQTGRVEVVSGEGNNQIVTTSARLKKEPFVWDGKTGLVTFWFDDAWADQYFNGFGTLQKYNIPAAVAVPSELIGNPAYMNWAQVQRLQHVGWEVTAHSRTHRCDIDQHNWDVVEYEMGGVKQDLQKYKLGWQDYVTPCGVSSDQVLAYAKQNYRSLRTSEQGFNQIPLEDPYALKIQNLDSDVTPDILKDWLAETKKNRYWLILMLHQVNNQYFEYGITPETLNIYAQIVKESGVPIVLPSDVLTIKK